jgi:hypothetical protein
MDATALRRRLDELQAEQRGDVVEGVHFTKFDVHQPAEARKAARHERQKNAVCLTPQRPVEAHRAEATPGPVPSNPRHSSIADRELVVATANAAAERRTYAPFACAPTAADDEVGVADGTRGLELGGEAADASLSASGGIGQRAFHASQQEALNAELRHTVETSLSSWAAQITEAKDALMAVVNHGPPMAATHLTQLKAYEDNYQCVHPLDDIGVEAAFERDLHLQFLTSEIQWLTQQLPRLDTEGLRTALDDLQAPFRGVGLGMPEARRKLRHGAVSRVDEAAQGDTVGASALRLYEDLYMDVLGPLRAQLAEGEEAMLAGRLQADDACERRSKALATATAGQSSATLASPRAQRASSTSGGPSDASPRAHLTDVARHQRVEIDSLADMVHQHAERHGLLQAAVDVVEAHADSVQADTRLATTIATKFRDTTAVSLERAAHDRAALASRAESISNGMFAQHREYLHDQAHAHSTCLTLETQEQAVWAEVAVKVTQAMALGAQRRELVLSRMQAREVESLRQRVAALELSLVRRRLHGTDAASAALALHADAAEQLVAYVTAMERHLADRNVRVEHDELWKHETTAAITTYGRAVAVTDDLASRFANQLDLHRQRQRQAELDMEMAIDCLDPDAVKHRSVAQDLSVRCNQLAATLDELTEIAAEVKSTAQPITTLMATRRWGTVASARDTLNQTWQALQSQAGCPAHSLAPAVTSPDTASPVDEQTVLPHQPDRADDEGDDSDNDDPQYASTRQALRLRLSMQERVSQLKDAEQDAAEAQLSHVRSTRSVGEQALHQNRRAFAANDQ